MVQRYPWQQIAVSTVWPIFGILSMATALTRARSSDAPPQTAATQSLAARLREAVRGSSIIPRSVAYGAQDHIGNISGYLLTALSSPNIFETVSSLDVAQRRLTELVSQTSGEICRTIATTSWPLWDALHTVHEIVQKKLHEELGAGCIAAPWGLVSSVLSSNSVSLRYFITHLASDFCPTEGRLQRWMQVLNNRGYAPRHLIVDVGAFCAADDEDVNECFLKSAMDIFGCLERFVAFEPSPWNLNITRRVLSDSPCAIAFHQTALGHRPGETTMVGMGGGVSVFKGRAHEFEDPHEEWMHFEQDGLRLKEDGIQAFESPLTTLDRIFLAPEHIDILKIDVEGVESCVLTGASDLLAQQRVDIVLFEVSEKWTEYAGHCSKTLAVVVDELDFNGYDVYYMGASGLVHISGTSWHGAFDVHSFGMPFCWMDAMAVRRSSHVRALVHSLGFER